MPVFLHKTQKRGVTIRRAIILVAGKGSRLLPATLEIPKCLVKIHGKTILRRLLESLDNLGIKEAVLVTGYLKGKIVEKIGNSFGNMKIIYVNNEIYHKTNNIYSLWLAKDYLKGELLIFGGDILIKEEVLKDFIECKKKNIGVISPFYDYLNGTVVSVKEDQIAQLFLKKNQEADFDFSDKFKTVNAFKFSADFVENIFMKHLKEQINKGNLNDFYEITIKCVLEEKKQPVYAKIIPKENWFEVDTQDDLRLAEKIVSKW